MKRGKNVYCKTSALEALGILTALMVDPFRFIGREVLFWNDNASTVIAFQKGYSRDPWATSVLRAARVVAARLRVKLFVAWEPRRSSHGSTIADNLTHNILHALSHREVKSYLELARISFPEPILEWMNGPGKDRCLGAESVNWVLKEYPALRLLID